MKRFKYIVSLFVFTLLVAAPLVSVVAPAPTAYAATQNCEPRLLGIPPWYRGMTVLETNPATGEDECVIESSGDIENFVLRLGLNIVEMAIVITGYIAFFFLLYGGFQFLTGGSNPGQTEKARATMLNAVIGLAIALGAVAITNLVFGVLG